MRRGDEMLVFGGGCGNRNSVGLVGARRIHIEERLLRR